MNELASVGYLYCLHPEKLPAGYAQDPLDADTAKSVYPNENPLSLGYTYSRTISSKQFEALSPAERPTKHGEIFAATPASDIVCGPCQMASGIGLQVFMTGRGTPYNLAAVPVIKVCSRNELKEQWPDIIDISAGAVATGEKTIEEVGTEIFNKIIACASGKDQPFAEKYRMHNYLCIFNPAPIT